MYILVTDFVIFISESDLIMDILVKEFMIYILEIEHDEHYGYIP